MGEQKSNRSGTGHTVKVCNIYDNQPSMLKKFFQTFEDCFLNP